MKIRNVLAAALLALASVAQAQVINGPDYVYVSGEATTKLMPDLFPVDITVSRISQDVDDTRRDIEGQVQNFVAQARAAGIQADDMDVSDLSVQREENEDEKSGKTSYLGHTVSRELHLAFRNVDSLRSFLGAIELTRDVEVTFGNPAVENEGEVRRKLLADAVRSARANAELLANASGRRLGPAHTVSDRPIRVPAENSGSDLDSVMVTGSRVRGGSADQPVVVEPKSVEIKATAYVIFRLID